MRENAPIPDTERLAMERREGDAAASCGGPECGNQRNLEREIVIVRDGDRYRLLHGQLRLASWLSRVGTFWVNVKGEGIARILKARGGVLVECGNHRLPLLMNE